MNTRHQPTFRELRDEQPEAFEFAHMLEDKPLFTRLELRNLGYAALLAAGAIFTLAEVDSPHVIDWTLGIFIAAPAALVAAYLIFKPFTGKIT